MRYEPGTHTGSCFHDALPRFTAGQDTPRAHLERCLQTVAALDPVAKALLCVEEAPARAAADASSARWTAGRPLSAIDGMALAVHAAMQDLRALRETGAVILGTTVGAAAVAARTGLPVLDTHSREAVLTNASCGGSLAFVPTPGALAACTAGTVTPTGLHAGHFDDLWPLAVAFARRTGGTLAQASKAAAWGSSPMPHVQKPRGLIVIESAGWPAIGQAARTAFEALMDQIACTGVQLLRRRDHPAIAAFEQAIAIADGVSALLHAPALALDAQAAHAALAPLADAIVMLCAPGHARPALPQAPAMSLPLMSVEGAPVGAKLVGVCNQDARLVSLARWVVREAGTVVV